MFSEETPSLHLRSKIANLAVYSSYITVCNPVHCNRVGSQSILTYGCVPSQPFPMLHYVVTTYYTL